ncbi:MAG: hypothetical protein U1E65_05530 [Myxococcota bacterium]
MQLLASLLRERQAAARRPLRYAIAFAEGQRYLLSTGGGEVLTPGFTRDADVTILTDQRTMSALLQGGLDAEHLLPDQLFLWGGDRTALQTLADMLGGNSSLLGLRAAATRGKQS